MKWHARTSLQDGISGDDAEGGRRSTRLFSFVFWIASVAVAVVLRGRLQLGMATVAAVVALHPLTRNALRPLGGDRSVFKVPRVSQYFAERPFILASLDSVSAHLDREGCVEMGLGAGYDTPEYLVRVANRVRQGQVGLHYLEPASPSARLPARRSSDRICALLVITPTPGWQVPAQASAMRLAYVDDHVALFLGRLNAGAGELTRP